MNSVNNKLTLWIIGKKWEIYNFDFIFHYTDSMIHWIDHGIEYRWGISKCKHIHLHIQSEEMWKYQILKFNVEIVKKINKINKKNKEKAFLIKIN